DRRRRGTSTSSRRVFLALLFQPPAGGAASGVVMGANLPPPCRFREMALRADAAELSPELLCVPGTSLFQHEDTRGLGLADGRFCHYESAQLLRLLRPPRSARGASQ